jgi:hypothetical protein
MAEPTLINLGPIDRIPLGEGREFEVEGELIAVFRARDGGVFGAQARCPHRAGHLADGVVGGGLVVCPMLLSGSSWRRASPWGMIARRSKPIASLSTRKERYCCRYEGVQLIHETTNVHQRRYRRRYFISHLLREKGFSHGY